MESTWQISWSSHTWRLENLRPANFSLYSKMRLIFQTLIVVFQTEDELLQFRRFVRGIISPRVTFWVCFLCYFLVAGLRSSALPCTIRCLSNMFLLLSVLVLTVITGVRWELRILPRKMYAKSINDRKAISDIPVWFYKQTPVKK